MKTHVERLPDHPARVLLEIEVEASRVEEAVEQAYRRVVRQLRIPGFRPGRAPRKIVELHVGKEALWQEAVDELIPELYREATRQNDIDPIDRARIDIVDMGVDKPLKFTAEVDVKPDVTLGVYEGVAVERRVRKIDDAAVEDMVERTRQQMAHLVQADKEALENGDFAVIDFEGFIDGEPFQGGAARGEMIEIGSGHMVPGFEEQLVGMTPEEEREIEITFPDTVREDLAGQKATFHVKLVGIKERRLPDLDDEFAKDTGQFETLEEMRANFRERLETAAGEEADNQMRSDLVERVAEAAEVDIPEVMVDHELDHMVREMQLTLAQNGLAWDQYLEMLDTTEADWKQNLREDANGRVKQELVLEAVAKAEGLEPDEDAVDERLRNVFGAGRDEAEVEEMLADDDRRAIARDGLMRSRALDWLVERADITEVEYEPEEPTAEDEDGEAEGDGEEQAAEVEAASEEAPAPEDESAETKPEAKA